MVADYTIRKEVCIPVDTIRLRGELDIPPEAKGIILFAHGSGSSRSSPRNRQVALFLQQLGFGTLLFDLLTPDEDDEYFNRFNIGLLADRLEGATRWLLRSPEIPPVPLGYFGASTGAAAALEAVTHCRKVAAIVSRGGRPDLVGDRLPLVKCPVLLIVGGLDKDVIDLNQKAFRQLETEKKLEIIPGATHLFEEAGKMDEVCRLAGEWFEIHLKPVKA